MRPLILLSNDDGIEATYLEPTAQALERASGADVLVVAPHRERSAVSHSITLHKPLRVREVATNRFSITGSPVDCVYIGVLKLAPRRPSLVVSGINRGFNLGSDVFYSGTVAAAVEGVLRGIPGIALSLAARAGDQLDAAAAFVGRLANTALEHRLPERTVLNVNFPSSVTDRYQWTRLGDRVYQDVVDDRHDPRGRRYYWIGGGVAEADNAHGTDCHAVDHGVISMTPLHLDWTHHGVLDDVPGWTVDGYEQIS